MLIYSSATDKLTYRRCVTWRTSRSRWSRRSRRAWGASNGQTCNNKDLSIFHVEYCKWIFYFISYSNYTSFRRLYLLYLQFNEFYLNHISRMTQRALEVLVAQEVQQDQACHSLVYQEGLAAQGDQRDRPLILLWAPKIYKGQNY